MCEIEYNRHLYDTTSMKKALNKHFTLNLKLEKKATDLKHPP